MLGLRILLFVFSGARRQLVVAKRQHLPRGSCAATPAVARHALLCSLNFFKVKFMAKELGLGKRRVKLNRNIEFVYDDSLSFLASSSRRGITLRHDSLDNNLVPPNKVVNINTSQVRLVPLFK